MHFLPLNVGDQRNVDAIIHDGVWLGIRLASEEYVVGTSTGIFKVRTVRRKPFESRWNHQQVVGVMGTPWKPYNFTESDKLRIDLPRADDQQEQVERAPHVEEAPRRFRIERKDLEKLGYTPGCPGCYNAKHHKSHRAHTAHCRQRVHGAMMEDPILRRRVEALQERENRWIAEQIEAEDQQPERAIQPKTPISIPVEFNVPLADGIGTDNVAVEIPGGETDDFYMEVNNDLAERISSEMMEELDNVGPDADLNCSISTIIKGAMKKLMETHTPVCEHRTQASLSVMRAASAMGNPHIAEIYSPPRVCSVANKYGMRPGFSLDLTVLDSDGEPWDFNLESKRRRALKLLKTEEPSLLIGSPMCRAFSLLQGLNRNRMGEAKYNAMMENGRTHLEFVTKLYEEQAKAGRYYLHEHPAYATSWKEPCIQNLSDNFGGIITVAHMCNFGMASEDMHGPGLVKKPTRFLTNSTEISRWLDRKCTGDHRHVQLIGNRAKACEVYPVKLCEAIVQGLRDQLVCDGKKQLDGTLMHTVVDDDDDNIRWDQYSDDLSGKPLRSDLVIKARQEEIDTFNQFPVYTKVPLEDAYHFTGKGPIGTMWIDVNKGDDLEPEYRCRLVAKEIKRKHDDAFVAATPPLEGNQLLFSLATTGTKGSADPLKLLFIDVKRAYFYARSKRPVFVQLPDEDYEEGHCGRLERSMYGTRDAASNWEAEYTKGLIADGFVPGVASPCAFYHPALDVRCVVHGDDFTFLGTDSSLNEVQRCMSSRYEVKVRGRLGPSPKDDKSIRILNRVLEWTPQGLVYEADQRHSEIIIEQLGLNHTNGTVTTPGAKMIKSDNDDDDLLEPQMATKYRALVARANFVASDRPDVQFAVKELAKDMANPKQSSWVALSRLGKYLKKRPRCTINYKYQPASSTIHISTDADWAGDKVNRKSTSGGVIQLGSHLIKSWSSTQNVIALSSGESEFYAIVKGASQGLGVRSLLRDLGVDVHLKLLTDASTGRAIASRRGLGKVRHIEVSHLWIQERVNTGDIEIQKIKNSFNPSDILTKHLAEMTMLECLHFLDVDFLDGRHPLAPQLAGSTEVNLELLLQCSNGLSSWSDLRHGCFSVEDKDLDETQVPRRHHSCQESQQSLSLMPRGRVEVIVKPWATRS